MSGMMPASPSQPVMVSPWWKQRRVVTFGVILVAIGGVYGLIYMDVVLRAKESYRQAEKYMEWNRQPEKKKEFFDLKFEKDKAALQRLLDKKKISEEEFKQRLEALTFDRDYAMGESSLKYAYQWYKDTYELFSPPESKWVRMARAKTPETLALWKEELRAKKIPFDDYMVE